jgi:hypothetical protein
VARESLPSPGTMIRELCEVPDMTADDLDAFYSRAMTEDLY